MQIYIHIPFCEQKCNYCRFASIGKTQDLHIAKYVSFLCEEIKNSGQTHRSAPTKNNVGVNLCVHPEIRTIYFGGGTPGVLKLEQFEKILKTIKNKYILEKECEISLETTPDKITKQNLIGWKKLGINRISMGVQTLNEKSLAEIGRGGKGDILEALKMIKIVNNSSNPSPYGYSLGKREMNISIDFIIGLPYVRPGEILENIKFILNKFNYIKHLSVYMLEDYYSPDKIIETKYDNITYPDDWGEQGIEEGEFLEEYSSIKKHLIESGFNNYEISNYGKPGFECKHNIGYWNHKEVLAFGLGAYGYINNTRYANSENFKNYYAGEKIFENKLTTEDIFLEKVMFQLRTSGIEEDIYKKLDTKKIDYFIENGYLEKKSNKIVLLDKGVLVMDYILKEII